MAGENTLVNFPQGGTKVRVESGGSIEFEIGTTDVLLTSNGTYVIATGIPAADPVVLGALWNNSGVLTLSAGP